jgi:PPM family protein phosphatase
VLRAYGVTDRGRVRASNQDRFAISEDLQLCVVADGMGGHRAGEVAAQLAVDGLVAFIRETHDGRAAHAGQLGESNADWPFGFDQALSTAGNRLRTAIHLANSQVLEASMSIDDYAGMGTTIVAALVEKGVLTVGHVGDSRLYLLAEDGLKPLTRDDSWMATFLALDPILHRVAARDHPMRNALTNVVGTRPRTEVHVVERPLSGGELILLSTDGVHGVLEDGCLHGLMTKQEGLRETATAIVEAAIARGSRDNCTAIVGRYVA